MHLIELSIEELKRFKHIKENLDISFTLYWYFESLDVNIRKPNLKLNIIG